jgi:hypothetical protein
MVGGLKLITHPVDRLLRALIILVAVGVVV